MTPSKGKETEKVPTYEDIEQEILGKIQTEGRLHQVKLELDKQNDTMIEEDTFERELSIGSKW